MGRDDVQALVDMVHRCSPQTRYQRFHGRATRKSLTYLAGCLDRELPAQRVQVAELRWDTDQSPMRGGGSRALVGVAGLAPVSEWPDSHELGVLVEDRWQSRGIGTMLVNDLAAQAWAEGVRAVRCEVCRAQPRLLAHLMAHARVVSTRSLGCDVRLLLEIAPPGLLKTHPPA
jgi:GNAT superfamily N-acetyltransferase